MSATFKHRLLVWVWGAVQYGISGAATAGGSILGGQALGAFDFSYRQLWTVAIAGGAVGLVQYLRTAKLPSIDEPTPCPDKLEPKE